MNLKYLFTARFANGDVIQQDQADVSPVDPKRSQYWDVLQRNDLETFDLRDSSGNGVTIDMRTAPANASLVFFRRHTHTIGVGEPTHTIAYCVGWKTPDFENTQWLH